MKFYRVDFNKAQEQGGEQPGDPNQHGPVSDEQRKAMFAKMSTSAWLQRKISNQRMSQRRQADQRQSQERQEQLNKPQDEKKNMQEQSELAKKIEQRSKEVVMKTLTKIGVAR